MHTQQLQIKSLLLLVLLLLSGSASGQPKIWNDYSPETLVFELNNKEALKLLKGKFRKKDWDKVQQTPFARFTNTWTDCPVKGHFLLATVEQNEVRYRYAPVIPFQVFLFKEYGVLTLQVVDAKGTIRNDAKVRLGNRKVYYDEESQTYTDDNWSEREQHTLTVELDEFRAIFDLTKHLVSPWYQGSHEPNRPSFYSYMITDKNKYKPGETVRFKSYALSRRRRPIKKELSLWMRVGSSWRDFKKIISIDPYHPGGFAGEFQLEDSLGLKLDRNYTIQLRDKDGRVVATTGFRYEDYNLNGNKLTVELDSKQHYSKKNNRVTMSATDANGLPLRETNVEVTVSRKQVLKSYVKILTLPDTLMSAKVELDASGKASVDIPSHIFGTSDCIYNVNVVLLTADHLRLEQQCNAFFYYSSYDIRYDTQADTLHFSFSDLGEERPVEAELSYGDDKAAKRIRLPYSEPFNQSIPYYHLKVPEVEYETKISSTDLDSKLKLSGGIEKDSLCVSLSNPLQLDFSWYVYQGNRLLKKGSGKEMEYKMGGVDPTSVYYVEIFYFMGSEECALKRSFTSPTERLQIESDLPKRVYPGQKVTTTLNVTDSHGFPVSNVDLTAFSVNSQLDYTPRELPYYGKPPQPREKRATYSMQEKPYLHATPLDYERWNRLVHLDRLPYYQFAYPSGNLFQYTVDAPDRLTQFAPYVMKDGKAVDIYVIELDDVPCYFSWTEHPQGYSFPVFYPYKKQKLTLRMADRAYIFDSISFEPGKKTILSFDMDRLPQEVSMIKLNWKNEKGQFVFSPEEKKRYENYLCRFPIPDKREFTYLEYITDFFPISIRGYFGYKKNVLAGPVKPGLWRYTNGVKYRHEGGYSYDYEGNVVYKYKDDDLCPSSLSFSSEGKVPTLEDFYLTRKRFQWLVDEYRKGRSWHPSSIYLSLPDKQLCFHLPAEKDSTGVANLLFRDANTGNIIYPDTVIRGKRMYSKLGAGMYSAILLYNNGKYLRQDSLMIRPNTYLDVNMESLPLHHRDMLSVVWLELGGESGFIGTNSPDYRKMRIRQYVSSYGGKACGYVVDESGEPVVGCWIAVEDTHDGTLTNTDGYFEINCGKKGLLLRFNYVGYKKEERWVKPGMNLMITMKESIQTLDEVVVTGYGYQSKNMLAGAIAGVLGESPSSSSSVPLDTPEKAEESEDDEPEVDDGQLYYELMQLSGLRRNFSDVAFWQPRLFTDKNGKARFDITFPDNMTKWETTVYAMNRHLQTGTFRRSTRSYKPLMAELKTPRFLIEGDRSGMVGTIRNYMEGDSIKGNVRFCVGKDTLSRHEVSLTDGHHETLPMQAVNADSVKMSYLFTRDDGYEDGEEYTLPILPQGTELAQGKLGILSNAEKVSIQPGQEEELLVSITDNQLDIYKESVNDLVRYKYLCNEQVASKLIGLLADQQYLESKGGKAKVDKTIRSMIRRLVDNQNKHQLWSWWGNSGDISYWMSAHILRALKMAKDAGYEVDLRLDRLKMDYVHILPYRGMKLEDVEILHALFTWGVEEDYSSAVRLLEPLVRQLEQREDSLAKGNTGYYPNSYLKEKLLLWEIRQRVESVSVADSLRKYLKKDILGAVYCDDGRRTYYWEGSNLINTLIAYRIVKNEPSLRDLKESMQLYILRTKERGWNTYQSSSAVATVLTDLYAGSNKKIETAVDVSGKENRRITEFPYQIQLKAGDSLTISKTGKEPLLYSVSSLERRMNARESDAFKVESHLDSDTLTAGVPVKLNVHLEVKQKGAQYVMIEVPIPAGCSYASKPINFSGNESHREYFKEKTVIFSQNLPVGTYEFSIPLLPQFTGKYTLNPAKVELMYYPVVNANNDGKSIWIKDKDTQ